MDTKARPVGLLMASDLSWFIHFLALLRLGVPVLFMLTSRQLQGLVEEALESAQLSDAHPSTAPPALHYALSYDELLDSHSSLNVDDVPPSARFLGGHSRNMVIMHSSGTTGLPKPIFHSHSYLLGYAACHRLSASDVDGAVNVSTLPLYHGFGLLAPCLALSVGMPVALFAATTIPTGPSVATLLRSAGATSLMTVPSIIEELFLLDKDVQQLKGLRFVAVGGAPMKHSVAKPLAEAGVALLNHWGVTEIGAIAPIVIPNPDYDWRFLRLRDDIGLRAERVNGDPEGDDGSYRLVGCAPGSDVEFVVQDLLITNPARPNQEFRIAGRADDLIVLATGEKVRPTALEAAVSEHPLVKAALAFGDKKFQLGLLVEAAPHVELDISNKLSVEAYVQKIWPAIEYANQVMDAHAEVTRDMVLVTTPSTRPLLRTPKGSVPRQPNVNEFHDEIEAVYNGRGDTMQGKDRAVDIDIRDERKVMEAIREELRVSVGRMAQKMGDEDDFFEHGMNSLQATVLRRRLGQLFTKYLSGHNATLPQTFVYDNPSVSRLACALVQISQGTLTGGTAAGDRLAIMQELVDEYIQKLQQGISSQIGDSIGERSGTQKLRVLLTGSTGSLGSSMLAELVKRPEVEIVYALNRRGERSLRTRQEGGLRTLGIELGVGWDKVVLLEVDLSADKFGLESSVYEEIQTRKIESFRTHFDAVLNIVELAQAAHQPVRILFSSSIAAVGRYPQVGDIVTGNIKETQNLNPAVSEHFGYAEAKWVCEQLFESAKKICRGTVAATSVRIGQLAGSEATGAWSIAEHFPMLVKSCQAVRKVPDIPGHASWIPVNKAASAMADILLAPACDDGTFPPILHLENPCRQSWAGITQALSTLLGLPREARVGFTEWLSLVKTFQACPALSNGDQHGSHEAAASEKANPAVKLIPFLEGSFMRLATGEVVLDTLVAQGLSSTLKNCGPVSDKLLAHYVEYWRATGFLA
ncbi:hypothetical protein EIP86_000228 [Pleurotus ostreatoroseus]|nr:hypothetical protein EIP86_000228 [Pleurotus ostreatoroseus]